MADNWSRLKRRFLHELFRTWSVLTVHSEKCLVSARREIVDVDARLLHFGISDESFAPLSEEAVCDYGNAGIIRTSDMATIRALYAAADYAAVPMHENNYSGITVALEAAALGVPILGTRTGALATYFRENEMLLAEVHDHAGLKQVVLDQSAVDRRHMADRARARFHAGDYTMHGMMKRYDALTREVLARAG